MTSDELIYYRHRAVVERQRAEEATSPHAADVHLRMAVIYERLVELEQAPQPRVRLVEVMNPDVQERGRAGSAIGSFRGA